jgi:predicted acetyltransferase/GrpB-like predicted nucleotidyltransferase (UPF0157 family)
MTSVPPDKDPRRLQGVDSSAHQVFQAYAVARGRIRSASIDEPITVVPSDPTWPMIYQQEYERLRAALPGTLVPEIQHIGSTAVPNLDAKPVVDIMVGLADPNRIADLVLALEVLGYESLGEAGVPGRWAMRRRETKSHFNISVITHGGPRWRQNLVVREFLRSDPAAARSYAAAKWQAVKGGAVTLFRYSDEKRSALEAVVAVAEQGVGARAGPLIELVEPSLERLPGYIAALETGWSPNTTRDVSREQLAAIHQDAESFVRDLAQQEGGTVTLADGTKVPRLPGRTLWIWDGKFCGTINLRFVPGSDALPPYVSGHVGYSVVPWKRNRGYAQQALCLLMPMANGLGLSRVLISCDEDNNASRRVIEANGGIVAGEVPHPDHVGKRKLLFWVTTA